MLKIPYSVKIIKYKRVSNTINLLDIVGQIILLSFTFSSLVVIILAIILPIKVNDYLKTDNNEEHKRYLLKLGLITLSAITALVFTSCLLFVSGWF